MHEKFWLTGVLLVLPLTGCSTPPEVVRPQPATWPGLMDTGSAGTHHVTIVIAHSSIVPGGVIGHAGVAVDGRYWDFGPRHRDRLQPMQAMKPQAGPWWDDPDQRWQVDRDLQDVLEAMPDKLHPVGAVVTIFQAQVTREQAKAMTAFWDDTYRRMRDGQDHYRLSKRQCASMAAWSLASGPSENTAGTDDLPREMRLMTPTALYESLRDQLRHTDGPKAGQPAYCVQWQLTNAGLELWQRPKIYNKLHVPELPRTRLAYERARYLTRSLSD